MIRSMLAAGAVALCMLTPPQEAEARQRVVIRSRSRSCNVSRFVERRRELVFVETPRVVFGTTPIGLTFGTVATYGVNYGGGTSINVNTGAVPSPIVGGVDLNGLATQLQAATAGWAAVKEAAAAAAGQ